MTKDDNIVSILNNIDNDKRAVLLFTGDKGSSLLISYAIERNVKTVFVDTGYHFSETIDCLKAIDGNIEVLKGESLSADPYYSMSSCCAQRKSEVLKRYLYDSGSTCLIVPFTEEDKDCGIERSYLKELDGVDIVRPLEGISWGNIWMMIKESEITFSSIYNKGYRIVDCSCCTTRHGRRKEAEHVRDDELERETEEKLKDLGYM